MFARLRLMFTLLSTYLALMLLGLCVKLERTMAYDYICLSEVAPRYQRGKSGLGLLEKYRQT